MEKQCKFLKEGLNKISLVIKPVKKIDVSRQVHRGYRSQHNRSEPRVTMEMMFKRYAALLMCLLLDSVFYRRKIEPQGDRRAPRMPFSLSFSVTGSQQQREPRLVSFTTAPSCGHSPGGASPGSNYKLITTLLRVTRGVQSLQSTGARVELCSPPFFFFLASTILLPASSSKYWLRSGQRGQTFHPLRWHLPPVAHILRRSCI